MEMAPLFDAGREEFVSFVLSNFWDAEDGMAMTSWYNPKAEISKASQTENGGVNSQRNMRGFAWVSGRAGCAAGTKVVEVEVSFRRISFGPRRGCGSARTQCQQCVT